ncbi:Uncharacterised protein [Escherichia coli]|nr:hypothetical protein [Escherichia coli]VWN14767.1 Uncharacterised protein [Escherichia coli]
MRPLMPPVQTPDNLFHDGNPLTGELGTIVDAEHLNNEQAAIRDTQSELIAILTAAAMEPASTAGQLLAALNKLYAPFNDTLGALSTLVGGANKLPYFTAADAAALTALSSIGRDIIGKATVADVLTYLGLGEAAKRDVGTGAGQIPDMSAWSLPSGGVGMPNGIHFRYGYVTVTGDKVFSTPFPNQCFGIVFGQTYLNNDWLFGPAFLENSVNKNGFTFMDIAWSGNSGDFVIKAGERVFYIAIGN